MAEAVRFQWERTQLGLICLLGEMNLCAFLVCCNEDVDLPAEHEVQIINRRQSDGFQR
jgi:hypothetical protein